MGRERGREMKNLAWFFLTIAACGIGTLLFMAINVHMDAATAFVSIGLIVLVVIYYLLCIEETVK